jgi:hypothetical protein
MNFYLKTFRHKGGGFGTFLEGGVKPIQTYGKMMETL